MYIVPVGTMKERSAVSLLGTQLGYFSFAIRSCTRNIFLHNKGLTTSALQTGVIMSHECPLFMCLILFSP